MEFGALEYWRGRVGAGLAPKGGKRCLLAPTLITSLCSGHGFAFFRDRGTMGATGASEILPHF